MMYWTLASIVLMILAVIAAYRSEGGQTLGTKQALYLAAFLCFLFSLYNIYQWNAVQTAPAEIEPYVPVYPEARLKTRVPVSQMRMIERVFATEPDDNNLRGQWTFETDDPTEVVGRFYRQWAERSPSRVGVQIMQEHTEVLVDDPNYSMTVMAYNQWGKTRITYTLMSPLE